MFPLIVSCFQLCRDSYLCLWSFLSKQRAQTDTAWADSLSGCRPPSASGSGQGNAVHYFDSAHWASAIEETILMTFIVFVSCQKLVNIQHYRSLPVSQDLAHSDEFFSNYACFEDWMSVIESQNYFEPLNASEQIPSEKISVWSLKGSLASCVTFAKSQGFTKHPFIAERHFYSNQKWPVRGLIQSEWPIRGRLRHSLVITRTQGGQLLNIHR